MMEKKLVIDTRLGRKGQRVYLLPFGVLACFIAFSVAMGGVLSTELLSFTSPELVAIWILLVISSGFFLLLGFGGGWLMYQAHHVVQRMEGYEKIVLTPFFGRSEKINLQDVSNIYPVPPCKILIPMSLLSRDKENWRIVLRSGQNYYINGDIYGVKEYMESLLQH